MDNYKIEPHAGVSLKDVVEEALDVAIERKWTVEFDFNGVKCLVNENTVPEYLYRDYMNSWTMNWKIVGPDCVAKYDIQTQTELDRLNKINEEEQERQQEEWDNKRASEEAEFNAKVKGVELELKDADAWQKSREINNDPYGKASLDYAEGWAKLMQIEIANGNELKDIAERTSFELNFLGITGFMYGCAVDILSKCWVHGEELRKWHNKGYGHDGDGVVNPAILTINV